MTYILRSTIYSGGVSMGSVGSTEPINFEKRVLEPINFQEFMYIQIVSFFYILQTLVLGEVL